MEWDTKKKKKKRRNEEGLWRGNCKKEENGHSDQHIFQKEGGRLGEYIHRKIKWLVGCERDSLNGVGDCKVISGDSVTIQHNNAEKQMSAGPTKPFCYNVFTYSEVLNKIHHRLSLDGFWSDFQKAFDVLKHSVGYIKSMLRQAVQNITRSICVKLFANV